MKRAIILVGALSALCAASRAEDTWLGAKVLGVFAEDEGRIHGSAGPGGEHSTWSIDSSLSSRTVVLLELGNELIGLVTTTSWPERPGLLRRALAGKLPAVAPGDTVSIAFRGDRVFLLDTAGRCYAMRIRTRVPRPPQAEERAGPEAPTKATVVPIYSDPPAADIEVDGTFRGSTPSTLTLQPGTYLITVTKAGFSPWSRKVLVTRGGSVRVDVKLDAVK